MVPAAPLESSMASSQAQVVLSPQLADLRKQFEASSDHARKLLITNDEGILRKEPLLGGWSVLQCVQHLALTNRLYQPIFDEAFPRAKNGSEPYKKDFKGRMLAWVMEPPYRMKVKTREGLDPETVGTPQQVLDDFLASQQMIFGWLDRANGLALNDVQVASPFNEKMRYNLFSLFNILASHERRHLWQAEQAKKHIAT
jgi:hypothetical protein